MTLLALACGAGGMSAGVSVAAPAAGSERITVDRDNLWTISAQLTGRYPGASRAQIMVALLRANPDAFVQGNVHRLRVSRPLVLPTTEAVSAEPRQGASELVQQHRRVLSEGGMPLALPALATATPGISPVQGGVPAPAPVVAASAIPVETKTASSVEVATSPASAVAVAKPASMPAVTAPVASVPAPSAEAVAASEVPAAPSGAGRWWLWALLGVLGGGAWLAWRTLGRGHSAAEASDEEERTGRSSTLLRQQIISNAAADMAKAVEAARAAHVMVNPPLARGAAVLPPLARRDLMSQDDRHLQLLIAQTWIEVGRFDDARELLQRIRDAADAGGLMDDVDLLWASLPASSLSQAA